MRSESGFVGPCEHDLRPHGCPSCLDAIAWNIAIEECAAAFGMVRDLQKPPRPAMPVMPRAKL
jgi:hypothetical protein